MTPTKDLWPVLEIVSQFSPEASDITKSARELPNARTSVGKCRAWFRLALMQKKLADYFQLLIEKRELLEDLYDQGAFLLSDEAIAIGGLFIGLNIIDCNDWCVKDAVLDYQPSTIDLKYCFKHSFDSPEESGPENEKLKDVLDQKNYLEELNRHLTATIENLRMKIKRMEEEKAETFEVLRPSPENGPEEKSCNGVAGKESEDHVKELESLQGSKMKWKLQ